MGLTVTNLQRHQGEYGLTNSELNHASRKLMELAQARLEANGADSPFLETKAKKRFLNMLEREEKALMEEEMQRQELKGRAGERIKDHVEALPIGRRIGYNKIDLTNDLNEQMLASAHEFAKHCEKFEEKGDADVLTYFINYMKTGSTGDLKNQERWQFQDGEHYYYNGMELRNDDPGNILFGSVGAVKYPLWFLQTGAGVYQVYSGTSNISYADSFFDDPRDSEMIRLGFELYAMENMP